MAVAPAVEMNRVSSNLAKQGVYLKDAVLQVHNHSALTSSRLLNRVSVSKCDISYHFSPSNSGS